MSDLIVQHNCIPAMSDSAASKVRSLESAVMELPQVDIDTLHIIHGGMYSRTIMIPAGVVLTGALIKRATTLIVCGEVTVFIGDGEVSLKGYHVLPASAGRKQAFITKTDTWLTMMFPTEAKTIAEAEQEFTDELDLLVSRKNTSRNIITITGE